MTDVPNILLPPDMVPDRRPENLEEAKMKLLEAVLAKAREAVEYHRSGYDLEAGSFDANMMVQLMDELGIVVDHCNVLPLAGEK